MRLADTAVHAGETSPAAVAHGVVPADLAGPLRLHGVGEEVEEGVAGTAVEQAAAGAATRLPVSILQTLLATEELTIPGPKVDEDREVRAKHNRLITRFVPAVRFLPPDDGYGASKSIKY